MSQSEETYTLEATGALRVSDNYPGRYTLRQPVLFTWKPKEDITAFEIAELLPFISSGQSLERADRSASYMRHFEIYDPNE